MTYIGQTPSQVVKFESFSLLSAYYLIAANIKVLDLEVRPNQLGIMPRKTYSRPRFK